MIGALEQVYPIPDQLIGAVPQFPEKFLKSFFYETHFFSKLEKQEFSLFLPYKRLTPKSQITNHILLSLLPLLLLPLFLRFRRDFDDERASLSSEELASSAA